MLDRILSNMNVVNDSFANLHDYIVNNKNKNISEALAVEKNSIYLGQTLQKSEDNFFLTKQLIHENMNRSQNAFDKTVSTGYFFVFIFVILFAIISYNVWIGIIVPIERLVKAAKAISEGNLLYKAEVGGSPETVELAKKFNEMMAKINELDAKKQETIVMLEEKDKELEKRNKELSKLNRLMVGRELDMVELKKRVKSLEEQGRA